MSCIPVISENHEKFMNNNENNEISMGISRGCSFIEEDGFVENLSNNKKYEDNRTFHEFTYNNLQEIEENIDDSNESQPSDKNIKSIYEKNNTWVSGNMIQTSSKNVKILEKKTISHQNHQLFDYGFEMMKEFNYYFADGNFQKVLLSNKNRIKNISKKESLRIITRRSIMKMEMRNKIIK